MSDKPPISNEKNSSAPHFYSHPETDGLIPQPTPTKNIESHKDRVEEFSETFSSLSFGNGKKIYDNPSQMPALVPPLSHVQHSSSVSSANQTTGPTEKYAQSQGKLIFENIGQIVEGLEDALNKVVQHLALSDTPEAKRKVSFMRKIAEAIQELKEMLQEIQIADALLSKNLSDEKFNQLKERTERLQRMVEKEAQIEAEHKKTADLAKVMKVLGPVLSALATVIGAGLAVVTFGASVAIILASVAVGAAFTTYSIVESTTGVGITAKIVAAFNQAVKELFPDSPEWVHTLFKIMTVVVTVAVLAIVGWAASGAVAANIAGKSATELAKVFGAEVTKQFAIQLIPMTVLSSNVIPEMIANVMKATGASEKDQKVAELVTMIIQLVVVLATLGVSIWKGVKVKLPDTQTPKSTFGATLRYFKRTGGSFKTMAMGCAQLMLAKKSGLNPDQIQMAIEAVRSSGINLLTTINKLIDLTNLGFQSVTGVILGISTLEQARLLREVGNLKSEEEFIQELIRLLEKIISDLQTNMDSRSDIINKIQEALTKFYDELNQNITQLLRPVQG